MKLLGIKILHDFQEQYAEARAQIAAWQAEVENAQWQTPKDIKDRYKKASFLPDNHIVFNFCWNKYRLLVQVAYKTGIVLAKKIGTHKQYDKW